MKDVSFSHKSDKQYLQRKLVLSTFLAEDSDNAQCSVYHPFIVLLQKHNKGVTDIVPVDTCKYTQQVFLIETLDKIKSR